MEASEESRQAGACQEEWQAVAPLPGDECAGDTYEGRVLLWALVLESRSIPYHVEQDGEGWQLAVPAAFFDSARHELSLYERENRGWPPQAPPPGPLAENTLPTLSVLILLATFHNITLLDISPFGKSPVDWVGLGSAQASQIRAGEWWRLFTALTLHADWLHLFSNLAIGGVFVYFLCRDLGSGLSWCLLLGSGALGNLVNAYVSRPEHNSIGASTAVFGAVGILGALSLVRYRHHLRRRRLLPVAAVLALLALLGAEGRNTDLGAHLFGVLIGWMLGTAAECLTGRYGRPGKRLNALLAAVGALVVVLAWSRALLAG